MSVRQARYLGFMGEHSLEHARVSRIEMRGRMGGKLAASRNATGNEATGQDHSDVPVTPATYRADGRAVPCALGPQARPAGQRCLSLLAVGMRGSARPVGELTCRSCTESC